MENYFIYKTPKGDMKIIYSEVGVTSIILPCDKDREFKATEYLENQGIKSYFNDYFAGKEPNKINLDIKVTPFQRKVFDLLLETKMGTFLTYGDIAKLINCGSSQAIGQALKKNPVPIIIACHRVVGKGWEGGFGGETMGEKMEFKRFLLEHEKKTL
jgi:methylated-DNA-[protein]-cysteine S-methyltransferase